VTAATKAVIPAKTADPHREKSAADQANADIRCLLGVVDPERITTRYEFRSSPKGKPWHIPASTGNS